MAGQLVMARFHWIPGFLDWHGGGGGAQPSPGRSFSPSHGSWCLQAPTREDKECGPAADRALHAHPPKAAPQGPCQALCLLSTPCQGPSAHLLTLGTPEWVFVCTPGAGWAEPRSKCWTEISPLGPGAARRSAHLVGGRSLFCRWPVLLSGSELGPW